MCNTLCFEWTRFFCCRTRIFSCHCTSMCLCWVYDLASYFVSFTGKNDLDSKSGSLLLSICSFFLVYFFSFSEFDQLFSSWFSIFSRSQLSILSMYIYDGNARSYKQHNPYFSSFALWVVHFVFDQYISLADEIDFFFYLILSFCCCCCYASIFLFAQAIMSILPMYGFFFLESKWELFLLATVFGLQGFSSFLLSPSWPDYISLKIFDWISRLARTLIFVIFIFSIFYSFSFSCTHVSRLYDCLSFSPTFFFLNFFFRTVGSSQSFSRSVFADMIPKGYEAEFFSFYAITDKGECGSFIIQDWCLPALAEEIFLNLQDSKYLQKFIYILFSRYK